MVQGALRLLLLCILGLQVSFGDSWGTREALSFARYYLPPPPPPPLSPPPPPPPQSSAAEVLAALEATYGEILVKWEQQFARWSALKTLTAGHGLPPLLPPPLLPPPPLPEFSAALRSQHSKAQLEWEQQAAASQDAPASSRKLLQRLNFENPNYHPSPPPPIPPPPPSPPPSPPSPPTPSGQGTMPWQGTLQGITSALGIVLAAFIIGVLISFSRVCCTPRPSRGSPPVVTGLPVGHGGHALPPLAAAVTAATSVPLQPPAAVPRKHVELVLVQNPGDDVCFAKEDERRGPQQACRP